MNAFLQRLGFAADDRVVIIHADDIGMCQATLPAIADLFDAELVSSASTMVPCAWFPETARFCREHPAIDMGIHLTLTSEMGPLRWGPISTRDPASGMLDDEGYFYRSTADMQAHGAVPFVMAEVEAQISRALAAGIDATHVDSHMGTVFHPAYIHHYVKTSLQAQLPSFVPRIDNWLLHQPGISASDIAAYEAFFAAIAPHNLPIVDHIVMMPLDRHADRVATAQHLFDTLPAGLSYFILHPAIDTPELRAVSPDWRCRAADYQAFCDAGLRRYVRDQGVQVIGWRVIRDELRRARGNHE